MSKVGVVDVLNRVIGGAWSASLQHQAHVKVLASWGLEGLSAAMQQRITDEPLTVDRLLGRLVDLGGELHFEVPAPRIGTDVASVLAFDRGLQVAALDALREAASTAGAAGDSTTRTLLEQVVADEEDHLAWLETEISVLERVGEALYTASRLSSAAATRIV